MQSKMLNKVVVEAKVIRADGTEEDLGVISTYEKPMTLKGRIKKWLTLLKL